MQRIISNTIALPASASDAAKNLVAGLLCPDAAHRLGGPRAGGIEVLKQHAFYEGLDWVALYNGKVPAPQTKLGQSGSGRATPAEMLEASHGHLGNALTPQPHLSPSPSPSPQP